MTTCVFCKIINKETPAVVLGENDAAVAFKTLEPVAQYHILIVPRKHIGTFLDISESDKETFIEMVHLVQEVINKLNIKDGYKLIFNGGKYQSIPHLHWHLLAGKLEDENDALNKT